MDIKIKDGQNLKINVVKSGEVYEYYIQALKIGVFSPNVMKDNFLKLEEKSLIDTLGEELLYQISEGINSLGREEIKKEAELNEKILKYAKEKGVEKEEVTDITVVDAKKYILDENDKEIIEDKENEEESDEQEEIRSTTKSDVNIKQEIELDERANDMHDFGHWLGGNLPLEANKIVVIESYEMNKMKDENGKNYHAPSTRYSLGVLNEKEEIEPLQKYIPNLRQSTSAGSNPTEQKYQVDKKGDVEKEEIYSEYEIGKKILQIDNKEMGRIELDIGKKEHGGNRTLGVQMSDRNSSSTSTTTRNVIGEYKSNGEYTVNKGIEEANTHKDCGNMDVRDIDGDPSTSSHSILDDINIDFADLAAKWGFYYDGKPDEEKAKEYLEKEIKKSPENTVEENIDKLTDDFNDDFGGRGSRH